MQSGGEVYSTRMCEGCGEKITIIRLKAKPNARHCVRCQETRDVVITANRVISAFAAERKKREKPEQESDLNFSDHAARGMLSTRGLSEYISTENKDYSSRASNTGHIVFGDRSVA